MGIASATRQQSISLAPFLQLLYFIGQSSSVKKKLYSSNTHHEGGDLNDGSNGYHQGEAERSEISG